MSWCEWVRPGSRIIKLYRPTAAVKSRALHRIFKVRSLAASVVQSPIHPRATNKTATTRATHRLARAFPATVSLSRMCTGCGSQISPEVLTATIPDPRGAPSFDRGLAPCAQEQLQSLVGRIPSRQSVGPVDPPQVSLLESAFPHAQSHPERNCEQGRESLLEPP